MSDYASVDCATGRRMGCQTYCCRLLVRLDPDECELPDISERTAGASTTASRRFVEKDADGFCIHLDRATHLCGIWDRRSRACRGYDCNSDFLLQVALRNRFGNIAELVKMAATAYIPREQYIRIPPREA